MDDISALLKEAKQLYFARKRRNNRIKGTYIFRIFMPRGVEYYGASVP